MKPSSSLWVGVLATAAIIGGTSSLSVGSRPKLGSKGQEPIGPIEDYECPGDGVFPHDDCQLFVECWAGAAVLFQCTDVMLFDLRYDGCNYAQYVDCGDRQRPPDYPSTVTPPETTPTTTTTDPTAPTTTGPSTTPAPPSNFTCPADGVFPHEEKCEYYWSCFLGEAQLIHCELDYLFDLRYNGCNFPQYVDCQDRERPPGASSTVTPPEGSTQPTTAGTGSTDPGDGFQCPQPDGVFPDPTDCSGFYNCVANTPIHEYCPPGLHFNPTTKICDWPADAGCEVLAF